VGNTGSRERAAVAVGTGGSIVGALHAALASARIKGALSRPRGRATRVVIKPTLAPDLDPIRGYRRYVTPALTQAVAQWLRDHGWPNVTIAVSGPNGEDAARRVGYTDPVHDLTSDTDTFYYGGLIGRQRISRTWRDADVRVLVGRALPDPQLMFTGVIATALGCVPASDALAHHLVTGSAIASCANDLLASSPVTFGVIDAWDRDAGADGPDPHQAVLASTDLFALDWVLGEVAGLRAPQQAFILAEALQRRGVIDIDREGDLTQWSDWQFPSAGRVVRTDLSAGRWWGGLVGWQEVPWTAR
jgi:uncharacterized protein (DUF362 family)